MEFSISLKDNGYSRIFVDEYYDEEEKVWMSVFGRRDRKSTRLNSSHT